MLDVYRLKTDILFFKQKTAYEMRISDWSSDVCSSDLIRQVEIIRADALAPFAEHEAHVAAFASGDDQRMRGALALAIAVGFGIGKQIGRASCRARVCQYV